jgi:hypothetical protein
LTAGWRAERAAGSSNAVALRLTLLGVGAMNSPRYAPAGLLVEWAGGRVMMDGGPGADPGDPLDAWLVTDSRAELIAGIRRMARRHGLVAEVAAVRHGPVAIEPRPVRHTSHPTYGYLILAGPAKVVWAPEFWEFPTWAAGADLMFADAAGWDRPIRFARQVGGHAAALASARDARRLGVRRLVFAHLGRPTIRAMDAGARPPFGEFGEDGMSWVVRADSAGVRVRRSRSRREGGRGPPPASSGPSAIDAGLRSSGRVLPCVLLRDYVATSTLSTHCGLFSPHASGDGQPLGRPT